MLPPANLLRQKCIELIPSRFQQPLHHHHHYPRAECHLPRLRSRTVTAPPLTRATTTTTTTTATTKAAITIATAPTTPLPPPRHPFMQILRATGQKRFSSASTRPCDTSPDRLAPIPRRRRRPPP